MSTLHDAARRVVAAWVSTRPTWIEQCNEAVLALGAALKAQPESAQDERTTIADLRCAKWLDPECADKGACQSLKFKRSAEPAQGPVACIRTWHKDGEQHAELRGWEDGIEGLPDGEHLLYTAAQQPEPAQEPVACSNTFSCRCPKHYTAQPVQEAVAQISANRVIAAIEEWKSLWWKVPPFASKVNRATREAITVSHNPLFALLLDAQAAKQMPKGCTTPSGCQQHGCHGECLPTEPQRPTEPAQEPVAQQTAVPLDTRRLDWLEAHTVEEFVRPETIHSEFADLRMRWALPKLQSYNSIGSRFTVREAIDIELEKESGDAAE